MTETTEKLLPCAHCDSSDVEYRHDIGHQWHFLSCTGCGHRTTFYRSKAEARAAWNRRVAEKPKWTKEPPTEEGAYWCDVGYDVLPFRVLWGDDRRLELVVMSFIPNACDMLTDFLKRYPNASWIKIDKPALPEEGGTQ